MCRDEHGAATTFAYSDRLLPQTIVKPLGQRYELAHDADGRPDQSRQAVAYDEEDDSLLVTLRDGKGFLQSYDGELLRELNWQDGPGMRFTHDADGRPQTIRTPDSLVTFGYGERGLVRETGELGPSELTYDASGQLVGVRLPTGLAVQYVYVNDRLSYLDVGGQRISYEYGPNDLLTAVRYPNGLRHELTHQHLGGLQRARLTGASGRVLSEQTYHYDKHQRLTGLADPVAQQRSQLRHDNESRLLAVSDESAGTVREQFSYDAAGSLSSLNGWPVKTAVETGFAA